LPQDIDLARMRHYGLKAEGPSCLYAFIATTISNALRFRNTRCVAPLEGQSDIIRG
jgi:hypothetical protein